MEWSPKTGRDLQYSEPKLRFIGSQIRALVKRFDILTTEMYGFHSEAPTDVSMSRV